MTDKATISFQLPNGETWAVPMSEVLSATYNALTYPLRVGVGFALMGWRGAVIALVLSLLVPLNRKGIK